MIDKSSMNEIQKLELEMYELSKKLLKLRKDAKSTPVENYKFKDLHGEVSLLDLFAGRDTLFAIHNMGQGCRYCTTWADGLNPFVSHLEDKFAVVLLSKDEPEAQRRMANSRGWRFRTASHGGGAYLQEQSVVPGQNNMPGLVVYTREGNKVFRKNATVFGPGDQFCSLWSMLSLAGLGESDFTPQFNYWSRPEKMEDGGENLR